MGSRATALSDKDKEVNVFVTGFGAGAPDSTTTVLASNQILTAVPRLQGESVIPDCQQSSVEPPGAPPSFDQYPRPPSTDQSRL